ncbi:tyrosine-protein kinase receptor Tie-1 precursor [Danio rerio]|uniref:Tyrosine-protein kinase receptor Tie-1 n=1 Tax=Danio rerio TaxID=7955 RepID=A0A2R8QM04_DANRE|nr:tyrosine-protein kinase receptor Tie-1 precursor [Danio rerio]|eukprot:NP_001333079.1 tyrosine-protein kinase receptor Tie-1 precursor [Danio rerio]
MLRLICILFLVNLSDAVMDLTMTSNGATSANHFHLSCISGERDTDGIQLSIKKDNSIVLRADTPSFNLQRPQTKEVVATGFTGFDHSGIFYCHSKRGSDQLGNVTLINNYSKGHFKPVRVTMTVSKGENVHLIMDVLGTERRDIAWKFNGNYYYMTPIADVENRTAVLDLKKVDESYAGIYSASYVGDSALYSAWMRLIVRDCPKNKWGSDCDKECPECLNGGVCHDKNGDCVCPPGFMGMRCETACREGMFGRNCQESCKPENGCQGLSFCLTDPYGCSCASGWHGDRCRKPCLEGMYGADCLLSCNCKNKGKCNRFSGCQCSTGWRGQYCEKSDRAPEILDIASNLEGNLNSSHKITCSATGHPLPSHLSIELRKLESTVLKAFHTILDSKKSTAHFEIPRLSPEHNGLWECRVSTNGGQDSLKFTLTVKEPPYPTAAPKLLLRSSRQLVVKAVDSYAGDGPIVSTKLLYKQVNTEDSWSPIIVHGSDQITLQNLKPSTKYHVRVQLARPGEGGEGPLGPEAIMETDCPGPSSPRNVQADALSISAVRLRWQPPEDPNGGIVKYSIEYQPVGQSSLHPWVDTDNGNKTTKDVTSLNGSTLYQFRVRAFSKVPGEWSSFVQAQTPGEGLSSFIPTTQQVGRPLAEDHQLLFAVVGSVAVTCVTILLALLALFYIRKSVLKRRRTFTYQSGSGEETILQFNSGTLTLTRRPKPSPEPLTYPILEWEDIKFEDVIGEGNFGQVIKAMVKKDGIKMSAAIKMLKEFASENDHRDFAGELEVLCKLGQHTNIINLIGACENRGYLYIAIEYAPYGNLLDFLRKSRVLETDPAFAKEHGTASTLTSQQLLQFAADVATGMHYLSDKQFIHRDLAARNVLVGDNLVAKIADFGLSRGEEVYVKKTMGRLPVRWMAIESLNYSVYTTKSDVWSFGVLLWEIVSLGGTPYCGMTCAELYEKLPQGYRMEQPRNCDDEVYELMRQCWRDRPYERPPFSQISVQLNRMQEARKAYVNMALFENFTYAGIDATAEEA